MVMVWKGKKIVKDSGKIMSNFTTPWVFSKKMEVR
jgi:hypothetical protein